MRKTFKGVLRALVAFLRASPPRNATSRLEQPFWIKSRSSARRLKNPRFAHPLSVGWVAGRCDTSLVLFVGWERMVVILLRGAAPRRPHLGLWWRATLVE